MLDAIFSVVTYAVTAIALVLSIWGNLAQIAPRMFQVSPTNKLSKMSSLWAPKMRVTALLLCAVLLSFYIANLQGHLKEKDTSIGTLEVLVKQKDVVIEKLLSRLKRYVDPTGLQLLEYEFEAQSCTAAIDASELLPQYIGKQEVALVCGLNDGTLDRHKDDRITIGPLFTPQKSIVTKVPFSKKMASAIEDALLAKEKELAPPKGSSIQGSFSVWFRLVLIPKGTDLANIHTLGEIADRGGVVSPFEVSERQNLIRPAKGGLSSSHQKKLP